MIREQPTVLEGFGLGRTADGRIAGARAVATTDQSGAGRSPAAAHKGDAT